MRSTKIMMKLACIPFMASFLCGASWFFVSQPACNYNSYGTLLLRFSPATGATASQWDDQSGNGNNLVQATGANQLTPTPNQFGSLPGMVSSGSPKFMTLTSNITGKSQITWFVVFKPAVQARMYLIGGPNAVDELFGLGDAGGVTTEVYDGTNYADFTDVYSAGTAYIWSFQSGSTPSAAIMKRNGSSLVSAGFSGSAWNLNMSGIGKRFVANDTYANGAYGPILVYDGTLDSTNTSAVTSCLAAEGWF